MAGHAPFALEEAVILGYNVERLRKAQSLTQTKLAHMIGISRQTIIKVEQGRSNLQLSMIHRIAEALNVSVIQLLTPPPDPETIRLKTEYFALKLQSSRRK